MASILARRAIATYTVCHRISLTNSSRKIHNSSLAQDSWLRKLLLGSNASESLEETKSGVISDKRDAPIPSSRKAVPPTKRSSPGAASASRVSATKAAVRRPKRRSKRVRSTPEEKEKCFQENIAFMKPRLGRRPDIRLPLVKKTTWLRTLSLCQTEEQLKKVVDIMPLWADMGNTFDAQFQDAFIRRCLYIGKPGIALEVFGNFGKYKLRLDKGGARELLNGTYDQQPLSFVIALTSLFNVYHLPPVTKDFPCCAMVLAACLKHQDKHAQVVANALYPHIKELATKVEYKPLSKGQNITKEQLPKKWTTSAMEKIYKRLPDQDSSQELKAWLQKFGMERGHIPATVPS